MDCAISSSLASITGAVAATADPPHIEEPYQDRNVRRHFHSLEQRIGDEQGCRYGRYDNRQGLQPY